MKAFYIEPHILHKGHYKLHMQMEVYDEMCAEGPINSSFNILAARLFSMTYANFLRMIRQDYAAELHGKIGYVSYSFPKKEDADKLATELSKRWNALILVKNGKPLISLDVFQYV